MIGGGEDELLLLSSPIVLAASRLVSTLLHVMAVLFDGVCVVV
jgi:hypothetical protein